MGRATGTLGPAPAAEAEGPTAAKGPTAAGPTAAVGPVVAMSIAEEPVEAREGPTVGGEGPWHTRGLKE